MTEFEHGHGLFVGVGADLDNTVTDANGLAEILKDPERCAYPAAQVEVLTEENATRAGVLAGLERLAERVDEASTAVFYFSGHGYVVQSAIGNLFYLMPHGYDDQNLVGTAISAQEFTAKLEAIKAKKLLVLLDCCFAGGLDNELAKKSPGMKFVKSPLPTEAASEFAKGGGRVIISSCKENEVSYTGIPYSQFTQALVEALSGEGNSNLDGYVRVSDLALYAAKTVPQYTDNLQNPDLHFDEADNFVVAYYAAGSREPKGLPKNALRQTSDKLASELAEQKPAPVFDHSGQTVEGNQTNIAGDVDTGGGMFNTGSINTGGGGFATGTGAKAGGAGSVIADHIEGGVMTGENARNIKTDTYIEKQDIARDYVGGNQYNVDSISGGNVVVGSGGSINVNNQVSTAEISQVMQPILMAAQSAEPGKRNEAIQSAAALEQEVSKGENANDEIVGGLIQDLVDLVPSAVSAIVAVFGKPILAGIVGPATKYVLKRIGAK